MIEPRPKFRKSIGILERPVSNFSRSMDSTITNLFNEYHDLTGSAEAAATLVLAEVQSCIPTAPSRQPILEPLPANAEYLTVRQAAKKYNLGERTVYRLVEDGLPVTRAGRAIRIRPRDLEKRLADSETELR